MGGLIFDPIEQPLVVYLEASAPATGNQQNIELWTGAKSEIGKNLHVARVVDGRRLFGNQRNVEWRGFCLTASFIQPGDGENFERPTKIENFYFGENENTDTFLGQVFFGCVFFTGRSGHSVGTAII